MQINHSEHTHAYTVFFAELRRHKCVRVCVCVWGRTGEKGSRMEEEEEEEEEEECEEEEGREGGDGE